MIDELLAAAKKVCEEAEKVCGGLEGDCTVEMSGLLGLLGNLRDEIKKVGGDAKKRSVVVNLGDVRDGDWETKAVLGLELMGKIRESGFEPYAESPYVNDCMDENWYALGLGEDGDVPLLIIVEIEDDDKFKSNVELIRSIVKEKAFVGILGDEEEEQDENGEDYEDLGRAFEQEAMIFEGEDEEYEDEDEED